MAFVSLVFHSEQIYSSSKKKYDECIYCEMLANGPAKYTMMLNYVAKQNITISTIFIPCILDSPRFTNKMTDSETRLWHFSWLIGIIESSG